VDLAHEAGAEALGGEEGLAERGGCGRVRHAAQTIA
jgi:hypothetical protein